MSKKSSSIDDDSLKKYNSRRENAIVLFKEAYRETRDLFLIAQKIKTGFDSKYTPCWQCIVGKNFGSCVSHLSKSNLNYFLIHLGDPSNPENCFTIELWRTKPNGDTQDFGI